MATAASIATTQRSTDQALPSSQRVTSASHGRLENITESSQEAMTSQSPHRSKFQQLKSYKSFDEEYLSNAARDSLATDEDEEDIDELVRLAKSDHSLSSIPTKNNNSVTSPVYGNQTSDDSGFISPFDVVVFEKMPPKSAEKLPKTAENFPKTADFEQSASNDEGGENESTPVSSRDNTLTRASAKELAEKFHEMALHDQQLLDVPSESPQKS